MFNPNANGVGAPVCMRPVIPVLLTIDFLFDFLLSRESFLSAVWPHGVKCDRKMADRKMENIRTTSFQDMLPDNGGFRLPITGDFLQFIVRSVMFLSQRFPRLTPWNPQDS
jgi:hypothetical protein